MNQLKKLLFFRKDAETYYSEAFELEVTYKKYNKAFKLYYKSAILGLAKGQYYAGLMMLHGRGYNKKDKKKAIKLISQAASQNHAAAQLLMSKIYHNGEFVKQNNDLGDFWITRYNSHNLEKPIIIAFNRF